MKRKLKFEFLNMKLLWKEIKINKKNEHIRIFYTLGTPTITRNTKIHKVLELKEQNIIYSFSGKYIYIYVAAVNLKKESLTLIKHKNKIVNIYTFKKRLYIKRRSLKDLSQIDRQT